MRRQLPAYSPLDLRSVSKACLDSLLRPGLASHRLVSTLSQRYPCERVVLTGSGTQALDLAIRLGLGAGRAGAPVALPAYSCFDVVTAAAGAGAPVLFYDLDPETLTPDMDDLRRALGRGARAVVIASLFGFPVDWDTVGAHCAEAGAVLIEDAAQGLGSVWGGREGGTFGDLTVLSFGRGKGWTGGGGGGLLMRVRGQGMEEVPEIHLLPPRTGAGPRGAAATLAQWGFGRPSLYGLPSSLPWLGLGETAYEDPVPPRAISAFSAALAAATGEAALAEVACRRRRVEALRDLVTSSRDAGFLRIVSPLAGGESSYLRFPVLSNPVSLPVLDTRAARSLGIMRGYPRCLPELPAAKELSRGSARRFPGAEELSRELFTVPTHSLLGPRDLARTARMFRAHSSSGA